MFYFPDGRPSKYPTCYEHGVEKRSKLYDDGEKCSICGMTLRYTSTKSCFNCGRLTAMSFKMLHDERTDLFDTDPDTGEGRFKVTPSMVFTVDADTMQEMRELSDEIRGDNAYQVTGQPCKKGPHFGVKRLGTCYQCDIEKRRPSARQAALRAGLNWYMPEKPCKHCGEIAEKRVSDGKCSACFPADRRTRSERTETPDQVFMRENPDMVLGKEEAEMCGLKVYRTGNACRHGHTGWRYISTGNCIECLKG